MQAKQIFKKLFFMSLIPLTAVAETNAMDGSFRNSIDLFSQGPPLKLIYNSRSLHEGVFGLGWCSEFEKKVVYRNKAYWLSDCNLSGLKKISAKQAQKLKSDSFLSKKFQIQKNGDDLIINNGQQKVLLKLKNSLLQSVRSARLKYDFQYDRGTNLSIVTNLQDQKSELLLYDDQDRVQTHQYPGGCFDQIQYEKNRTNQFTTLIERSCPEKPKEKILYVFSIKLNKKQQRQISSIQIRRELPNRLSQIP